MTRDGNLMDTFGGDPKLGNALDLGRPELTPLMNRYGGEDPPRAQTSILGPPAALIVEHNGTEEAALRSEIEAHGWFVKSCPGPGTADCPIMHGRDCSLRKSVDAAFVFIEPRRMGLITGTMPRLRCAADSASPAVVAVEGSFDAAREAGSVATIGSLRGPEAILAALKRLIGVQGRLSD